MSRFYFDNLAEVRGVAAAVVLFSHVVQLHFLRFVGLNTPLHQFSSITSEYAVVVFFILSGYLITHTLEANIERNGKLRLDIYAAARIVRLYPPFLYAIGVAILSTAAAAGVALVGGVIEGKKSTVQNGLLTLAERLRRLRVKTS